VAKSNKKLLTALKLVFSAFLLYFIFSKLNFEEVYTVLRRVQLPYLVAALMLFVISKGIAALRLNLYFHQLGVRLTQKSNGQLYLLGMFYNLFLPGGIGGDAYKGYLIQKRYKTGTKKIVSVLLLDRLSGLLLLFLYAIGIALNLNAEILKPYRFILILALPSSILFFWILHKRFFPYVLPIFWKSFIHSAFVQFLQLICIWLLLHGLGLQVAFLGYLFIFLLSSIVAVLPLTLGGIGSRELTFFYGATWLNLDENTAIGISILFFFCTALVSLSGIFYHFKKPILHTKEV